MKRNSRRQRGNRTGSMAGSQFTPRPFPYDIERNPWKRSILRIDLNSTTGLAYEYSISDVMNTLESNGEITTQNRINVNMRLLAVELWAVPTSSAAAVQCNLDVSGLIPSAQDLATPTTGVIFFPIVARLVDLGGFGQCARTGWRWHGAHSEAIFTSNAKFFFCSASATKDAQAHLYVTCEWNLGGQVAPVGLLGQYTINEPGKQDLDDPCERWTSENDQDDAWSEVSADQSWCKTDIPLHKGDEPSNLGGNAGC